MTITFKMSNHFLQQLPKHNNEKKTIWDNLKFRQK